MKTKIKTKLKLSAYLTLALIIGVVALGGVSRASSGSFWEGVQERVSQLVAGKVEAPQPSEDLIGAVSGPDLPNPNCQGGECSYVLSGTFTDGVTTTIISFSDPFLALTTTGGTYIGASSTVSLFRAYITGAATTSLTFSCGAATSATALPTHKIVIAAIATSTTGILENNVSSTLWAGYDGGAVPKVMLGPGLPYFNCAVATQASALDAALTQVGNTFDGRAVIRVNRLRF